MKSNKGFVSNMCYIDLGDSLVALDAGPTYSFAKEFYTLIKAKYPNKKVSHVVLSNFHDDRVLGASFFKEKDIKIVGHKTINNEYKKFKNKFGRIERITSKELYNKTKLIDADILVDGGYKIVGSKKTIEIIKPSEISEEKSDIAIYSKSDSFLFVGNIVFNGRMLNYRKASNIDGWIEALEYLSSMNAKYFLGGHGAQYDKDAYKYSLEYLKALRVGVRKSYDDELDVEDVKGSFSMDKFKNINHFSQLHSNNINNYYTQLEWE
ncbi:MAG TPA: MBL fold metallo-hydrolase [Arcobacter sp.]|nr:MBL fold metallo-hydrolase [Arcobacter sp.]